MFRESLIRLANECPEFRKHIIPLLRGKIEQLKLPNDVRQRLDDYHLDLVGDDLDQVISIAKKVTEGIDKSADVCKLSPFVCNGNMGLTRDKMPQIPGDMSIKEMLGAKNEDGSPDEKTRAKGLAAVDAGADPKDDRSVLAIVLDTFRDRGVKIESKKIPVGKLKATQSEIRADKTFNMADAHLKGEFPNIGDHIVVSKDGYILDGHHRWAALLTIDPGREMSCLQVDMPMEDILDEVSGIPGVYREGLHDNPLVNAIIKTNSIREDIMYHRVANRYLEAAWGMPTMPRGSYLPKEVRDTEPVNPEGTDLAIWKYEFGNKFVAIAFAGKANKPLWHYNFSSDAKREAYINETIESRKSLIKRKQDRQQARREWQHSLKEGDILVGSWGYDQTNQSWYQVVGVSDKAVVIREIASKIVESNGYSNKVIAIPGKFIGPPLKKIPSEGNSVKIQTYLYVSKWDGKPRYETNSMYGH